MKGPKRTRLPANWASPQLVKRLDSVYRTGSETSVADGKQSHNSI
jgi:hypothetical protein